MIRKLTFPILLGLAGLAVLLSLGVWQMQRLAWKEGILAEIDARLSAPAVPLDLAATEERDEYAQVTLRGAPTGEELHVLTSGTAAGTGYRVISKFRLQAGRLVLVDLGLLALRDKDVPPQTASMQITGTLLWPDDQNDSTPKPDLAENIWFARNVPSMAEHLGTAPIMVIASQMSPADTRLALLTVETAGIKNDHWEYMVTWFLLAFVWAVMTMFWISRLLRQKDE